MSTENKKGTQALNEQDQKNTSGGSLLGNGLLGNDNNSLTGITQGYVNQSSTDDNGDTSSNNLDFGSGSLLDSSDGGGSHSGGGSR